MGREWANWIERRPDPADRRARRLYLTGKARPVLGRIWSVANETRDEALARLSAGEAMTLIDLLQRVQATLSERVPTDGIATRGVTAGPRAPQPRPAMAQRPAAKTRSDTAIAAPVAEVEVTR